ncbi:HD-GYP domain-containing protein [Oceanobacillus halotolerans]|uniref:HD-GYP domain-containing protein n=1 Tax=Oceanobacillus halotolerans TaxID=2663380 RepID=UPI0013D2EB84|nr:HD domain-containing phosphohydrolase [Oceanobacillus halotolerans]
MNKTPQSLFNEITQDNDVLREFKNHSNRVMYLTTMLGKAINCYDEELKVAALLHDIGKMGLSKSILFKPEKLTPLEKRIIESHSHVGNLIVRKELNMPRAAQFVRDHHENWDGSGYPRGLKGEDISIQGRMIRICDTFDTMTYEVRHYSTYKMSHEEAFEELRRCAWREFDGQLVETFISLVKEHGTSNDWSTAMKT